LVPLRTGGSIAPLFCIHPSGGFVNVYESLVHHLPSELPVYGIQSRALFEGASEHTSISEMASHYASLIREKQPSGAVKLLGFSFGGFMAMAVARLFEDAGRSIAFLGLIDADFRLTAPDYMKNEFVTQNITEMYRLFTRELKLLEPLNSETLSEFARSIEAEIIGGSSATRVDAIFRSISERGYVLPGLPDRLLKHYLSLYFTHFDLLAGHTPDGVQTPLVTWTGRETGLESSGWRQFTRGSFSENFIEGAHYDLMYPPLVDSMAAQIAAALRPQSPRPAQKKRAALGVSANGNGNGSIAHRTSAPLIRS
jgi:nonribosomal peptide synthetase CepC